MSDREALQQLIQKWQEEASDYATSAAEEQLTDPQCATREQLRADLTARHAKELKAILADVLGSPRPEKERVDHILLECPFCLARYSTRWEFRMHMGEEAKKSTASAEVVSPQQKVRWVRQEEPCGCALACLAMVTGQTYAEVRAAWPADYNFETGGITNDDALHYLGDRGIRYHRRYRFVLGWNRVNQQKIRPGWPEVFAPVHIIGLGSGRHDVVLLADGTILDPQQEQPRRLEDVGEVAFMIGVWPSAEVVSQPPQEEIVKEMWEAVNCRELGGYTAQHLRSRIRNWADRLTPASAEGSIPSPNEK